MEHTDEWKDIIDQNRGEFEDDFDEVEAIWDKVAERLPVKEAKAPRKSSVRYWAAATVLLGAACLSLLIDRWKGGTQETALLGVEEEQVQDFSGTVSQFTSLISHRKEQLASFAGQQGTPLESFYVDLAQLSAQYDELAVTLEDTQDPRVLRAMIFNLELQLQLLNQQVEILETTHGDSLTEI